MTDSSRTGSGSGPRRPRVAGLRKRDARNTRSAGGTNGSREQGQPEADEPRENGQSQGNGQSQRHRAEQVPAASDVAPDAASDEQGGEVGTSAEPSGTPGESAAGTGGSAEPSTSDAAGPASTSAGAPSAGTSSAGTSSVGGAAADDAAAGSDESDTQTVDASSLPGSTSSEADAARSDAPRSGAAEGDESEPAAAVGDGTAGAGASSPSGKSSPTGKPSPSGESVPSGRSASAERSGTGEGSGKSATSGSGTGTSGSSTETSGGNAGTSGGNAGTSEENAATSAGAEETSTTSKSEVDESGSGTGRSWPSRRTATAVLLIAAVLFGGLAFVFRQQAAPLMGDSGENDALVDTAETSAVNGQAKEAVSKVFSYDFANTAKAESEAKKHLVGPAVEQYDQLFATVKQQAPQQKLLVTTSVKESGVKRLQADRAEVLAFVNQNATRTETKENSTGQAQVSLGMVKQGDQWKINNITQR